MYVVITFLYLSPLIIEFQLSDKYDRDRLALPPNSTNLRNKDREVAPHLAGSSRTGAREPLSTARRAEPREGGKKKLDDRDDWRKGNVC